MNVKVSLSATVDGEDGKEVQVESTWGRELWFCSLHAVHHFSLIRTILTYELGVSEEVIAKGFGIAPSTLSQRKLASGDNDDSCPRAKKSKL